jgi:SpoVK/Ycf46/Vps4 family AAA+-type ATPase
VLAEVLRPLSEGFASRLFCEDSEPTEWLRDIVTIAPQPHLNFADFPYLQESFDFLLPYLKQTLQGNKKGVNVFLYGVPGTGKTQVARLFAQALDCQLYEVAIEDEEGESIGGERRLSALCAAQSLFQNSRAMLLFDEVEDVFGYSQRDFWGHQSVAQRYKAWMNRMLEENTTPVFWLGNSIDSVDPAYIRRFDWVIDFKVPPRKKREEIIRNCSDGILPEKVIRKLADCERLAPAVVTRAAKVVNTLRTEFSDERLSWAMQTLINKTLIAQGHLQGIEEDASNALPDHYDLTYVNTDVDLAVLAQGLCHQAKANLCFYGLPGTGKSAYSRWLSRILEKPLVVKRCSEILSAFVGGSEKNIAQAFREAEYEGAILLVDEIDSVLYERRHTQHSWEVTCVNEMLTQMESYQGIFIATTNRMDFLDTAAMRRFDLKVKFLPLTTSQSWQLFNHYCQLLGLPKPATQHQRVLQRIEALTPGDFALLARQTWIRPLLSVDALLDALGSEQVLKTPFATRAIGFV